MEADPLKHPKKEQPTRRKKQNPFDAKTASLQILMGATAGILVLPLLEPTRMLNWLANVAMILIPAVLLIGVAYKVRQALRKKD